MNGVTILVVEDESQVRDVVAQMLRRAGYAVVAAATGAEAEAVCRGHPGALDLLLVDVGLPDASGTDLARRLRALRPAAQVLLTSGDALGVGAWPCLAKPFRPAALVQKVREVLAGPGQPTGGGSP
jgi:DNA-binding response OmpR family regulator